LRKTKLRKDLLTTQFEKLHGQGSSEQLLSLLRDSYETYQAIGQRFGVSRQRIYQLAHKLKIDGRQRERQRTLRRLFSSNGYSADVGAVIHAIKKLGFDVEPYRTHRTRHFRLRKVWKKTVLVNGAPCRIYSRRHDRGTAGRGRYLEFYVGSHAKKAEAIVLAVWKGHRSRFYVIPARDLTNVKSFVIPISGKYGGRNKPKQDWTAYEGAWQFIPRVTLDHRI
jgi:biotin operon repressor